MKFKWYTNGIQTIKIKEGEVIPEGFNPGRTYNKRAWNKGLTKETDERLNRITSSSWQKGHVPWNKGLKKENCESLRVVAQKVSKKNKGKTAWNRGVPMPEETKAKLAANHNTIPYNKGLTKADHPSIASTSMKLKGHKVSEETIKKGWETKRKNHSHTRSKMEDTYYEELCLKYGKDNIERNYSKDPRYPYLADFYIVSEDLFIEYNLFWKHCDHPFNPDDSSDIELLSKWKEKAAYSNSYKDAIDIWTRRDVVKLDTMRKNHLNFKIIYKKLVVTK